MATWVRFRSSARSFSSKPFNQRSLKPHLDLGGQLNASQGQVSQLKGQINGYLGQISQLSSKLLFEALQSAILEAPSRPRRAAQRFPRASLSAQGPNKWLPGSDFAAQLEASLRSPSISDP